MIRAYLGGSFDPVHTSHIAMAMRVWQRLRAYTDDCEVSLLPTAGNPFKDAPTNTQQRIDMLQLAICDTPLALERCELARTPPVYTIDTVRFLKQKHPDDTLIFILGQDSLNSLPRWKHSDVLIDSIQFWAFSRVGEADDTPPQLPSYTDLATFLQQKRGIYLDTTPMDEISSTHIRTLYQQGRYALAKTMLNDAVHQYICTHKLYQDA